MKELSPYFVSKLLVRFYDINASLERPSRAFQRFCFDLNAFNILKDNINVALNMDIANA